MRKEAPIATACLLDGSVLAEQIELETRAVDDGIKRYRRDAAKATRRGDGANLKPAERLLAHWFEVYTAAIDDERKDCRRGRPGPGRTIHGPVLEMLKPQQFAVVAMHEAVGACMAEPGGVKAAGLVYAIGRSVLAEINLRTMAKTDRELIAAMDRAFQIAGGGAGRPGRAGRRNPRMVNWWAGKRIEDAAKTRKGAVHVGAFLLHMLMEVASCTSYVDQVFKPAFQRRLRREGKKTTAYISLTDDAQAIIDQGHRVRQLMRPVYLPMIVRPYRWLADTDGGYVRIRTPFISKPTPTQKAALAAADLTEIYDCLEAVTGNAWRDNQRVLDVQHEVWKQGGNILGIPRRDDFPYPPHPPGYDWKRKGKPGCWRNVDPDARRVFKRGAAEASRLNRELRPDRKEFLIRTYIADLMRERPAFYLPHQLDFRSRCYPIPPHLNHQTEDTARGLLEFAEAKPPGEEGRRELMIEAANCFGFDKLPFRERVQWAMDHERQIAAAARDPLGQDWWHPKHDAGGRQVGGADKPWQFLATCIALNDPEAAAHAPVRPDGTCNGLQHYAAISRDQESAELVNLAAADAPRDPYREVSDAVRPMLEREAGHSHRVISYKAWGKGGISQMKELAARALAAILLEYLGRSLVKQTVMTTFYDVTAIGATKQIKARLKEAGYSDDAIYAASQYLSSFVLDGVGEVCAPAKEIMAWLKRCAFLVARGPASLSRKGKTVYREGNPVAWTTPLGFPVVQPYRRYKTCLVTTIMQDFRILIQDESVPVMIRKQTSGIAPNFIHSIDSSHMFATARACREEGIAFAAAHDCFWTHAATAPRMGRLLRERFVALHERPLLEDFAGELARRNPGVSLPPPPARGTFDIREVLESPYFFS